VCVESGHARTGQLAARSYPRVWTAISLRTPAAQGRRFAVNMCEGEFGLPASGGSARMGVREWVCVSGCA
jgi:hypothetical protein